MTYRLVSPKRLTSVLFLFCILLAGSAFGSVAEEIAQIRTAANSFIETLDDAKRDIAVMPFDHSERVDWRYVPAERLGLGIRDMDAVQKAKLDELLKVIHSADGLEKSKGVMICESVLYENSGRSDFRDPGKYHIYIFGEPHAQEPWGLRFEGHHLSLNYTFIGDTAAAAAPAFYGANPATILEGPHKGLRILGDEEDLARDLVQSLSRQQQNVAIFSDSAPREIFTRARSQVSPLDSVGIAYSEMDAAQQKRLASLIAEYLSWMPEDIAAARLEKIASGGMDEIHFGWAGPTRKDAQHYYRVQGPSFLIEYDNFQGGGSHIHAVWRDFDGDFGRDLLREHYEHGHPH